LYLQIKNIESTDALLRQRIIAEIPIIATNIDIAARTECFASCACEDNDTNAVIIASECKGSL
jgi:hypothetical protein